jgi:lysozyme family protein
MGDLSKCLPITLKFEGGFSDNPKDPGGATMNGITLATFRRYRPGATKADLRAISPEVRQVIYSDGYWRPISGDNLPPGVDLAAFDYGVNSGPGAANKALAATVGLSPVERVKAICARRLSLLQGLKTWATFGKGWGARVHEVEATGIKWASASPQAAKDNLTQAAKEAQAKASTATNSAIGATAATPIAVKVAEVPAWEIAIGVGSVAALVVLLIFIASQHKARAAVLASNA